MTDIMTEEELLDYSGKLHTSCRKLAENNARAEAAERARAATNYSANSGCREWILTKSRRKFWPLAPRTEDLHLPDIAWALSFEARYSGHTSRLISVAEHSVLVSFMLHRSFGVDALLHDASEAYLRDISRPVKHSPGFEGYRAAERNLQGLIYAKWRTAAGIYAKDGLLIWGTTVKAVQDADGRVLMSEAAHLMTPIPPEWAETMGKDCLAPSLYCRKDTVPVIGLPSFLARALWWQRWRELQHEYEGQEWSKWLYYGAYYVLRALRLISAPDYSSLRKGP